MTAIQLGHNDDFDGRWKHCSNVWRQQLHQQEGNNNTIAHSWANTSSGTLTCWRRKEKERRTIFFFLSKQKKNKDEHSFSFRGNFNWRTIFSLELAICTWLRLEIIIIRLIDINECNYEESSCSIELKKKIGWTRYSENSSC